MVSQGAGKSRERISRTALPRFIQKRRIISLIAVPLFRRLLRMDRQKENLLGYSLDELEDFVQTLGESAYRGRQLFQWLYQHGAVSFSRMSSIGKGFRDQLEGQAYIRGVEFVTQRKSAVDGTTKYLFELADGLRIESVLIPPASAFVGDEAAADDEQQRLTLCLSTQVGCPLDCRFCATGAMGYRRNLTPGEIVDQLLAVRRRIRRKVTNVVFMGMGEPLLNYDAVMAAVEIIVRGMGIAARRITVSTAGWADGIRRMGEEQRKVKLAGALHSANDETRSALMPVGKRFPLASLLAAIEHYYERTGSRITYEYIFFEGVNDSPAEVRQLIKLAGRVPCKINVIPFHAIGHGGLRGLPLTLRGSSRMAAIVEELRAHHLTVMVRSSAGEDIDAACGQLAVRLERVHKPIPAGSGTGRTQAQPA